MKIVIFDLPGTVSVGCTCTCMDASHVSWQKTMPEKWELLWPNEEHWEVKAIAMMMPQLWLWAVAVSELAGYPGRQHTQRSHYVTAELPPGAISTIEQNFTRAMPEHARIWNYLWLWGHDLSMASRHHPFERQSLVPALPITSAGLMKLKILPEASKSDEYCRH